MLKTPQRRFLLSLLAALSTLAATDAKAFAAATEGSPRVVVSILIDQLRSDYLEAFMPLYGDDGFKQLLADGRVFSQAAYPMARPDAASAAATVATGAAPSTHGIIGRKWIDRATLRPVFCVADASQTGLGGTTDKFSPAALGVTTIGDELKVASEGRAFVYAIAPDADQAILSAGHAADAAVWLDNRTGRWSTSSYYGSMPAWAGVRNADGNVESIVRSGTWRPYNDLVGNFSYFLSGGMKAPFAHKFKGDARYTQYKTSALVNEEIAAAASACIDGTMLGADAIADHLALTFYAGGFAGHTAAEAPMELQDTYVRLDRAIASVLAALEKKVGLERALVVLTSTGYVDEHATDLSRYRIPTGTFDMQRASGLLNMYLTAIYGQGNFVEATLGTQLYLNHKLIEQKQLSLVEVMNHAQDFLLQLSGVKDVYTSQRLLQGAWTPGISRIRAGYFPATSGDVMIEVSPGWRYVNADTHEDQPVRESYISYPIIFYGAGTAPERIETAVTADRIAPTLSKAMRIRAPNACAAAPLF